eukprot:GHVU01127739.1.p1 GENE.GHVU01127739.1~~GHVU01127739.1.p1  ORF type:complete len:154 (-),score=4.66 GHVU01127739.1:633-1094(-)
MGVLSHGNNPYGSHFTRMVPCEPRGWACALCPLRVPRVRPANEYSSAGRAPVSVLHTIHTRWVGGSDGGQATVAYRRYRTIRLLPVSFLCFLLLCVSLCSLGVSPSNGSPSRKRPEARGQMHVPSSSSADRDSKIRRRINLKTIYLHAQERRK